MAQEEAIKVRLRNGGEKMKKTITIGDSSGQTGMSIDLCLWGNAADMENFEIGDVVSFGKVRISDFHGRSLNTVDETVIDRNPDLPETEKL